MARSDPHPYYACRDPDCPRIACQAYKTGYADGVTDAMAAADE